MSVRTPSLTATPTPTAVPVPRQAAEHLHLRPARLVDVPAVARLVELPESGGPGPLALAPEVRSSALRLLLAHVGLDRGAVWVATDAEERVHAAAALLPPLRPPGGAAPTGVAGLELALRLELGLSLPSPAERSPHDGHWLLLPVPPGPAGVRRALLAAALAAVDATGLPALAVADGPSRGHLHDAGFRAAGPVRLGGCAVLLRPGAAAAA